MIEPSDDIEVIEFEEAVPDEAVVNNVPVTRHYTESGGILPKPEPQPSAEVSDETKKVTSHVSNVLDGKSLEEAEKAVADISVIVRALKVILMIQCTSLFQRIKHFAIKNTNNNQLSWLRVLIKHNLASLKQHHNTYLAPRLKKHGKIVTMISLVLSSWLVFLTLYWFLFDVDFMERSYEGLDGKALMGPLYKRNIAKKEKQRLEDLSMKKHAFNSFLSDNLALNRKIPDTRSYGCPDLMYPHKLATASIIIVFHNEALTVLLRTIHSVLNRSPEHLLYEIILVDDFSDSGELDTLDDELYKLPKTRRLRMPKRSGLIRARLLGASNAGGDVMVFLDSHCECNKGWLEPLLFEIKLSRRTVPSPVIDVIVAKDFRYEGAVPQVGAFDWSFTFYWQVKEQENLTAPIIAPIMAGGLFAINRAYFEEVGTYDTEMNIWGGENLEMSFRIWMCGGRLVSLPCSRVGHVFRNHAPYSFDGADPTMTLLRNYARAAEVWMDQHKELFYRFLPHARDVKVGDVSSRLALKKRLKCKSFDWYLEHLLPQLPTEARLMASGQIRNKKFNHCVDTLGRRKANDTVGHYRCLPKREAGYVSQMWMYSKTYEIISLENCLDASVIDPDSLAYKPIKLFPCHKLGGNQKWFYSPTKQIIHDISQLCLTVGDPRHSKLFLSKCDHSDHQEWIFTNIYQNDDYDF